MLGLANSISTYRNSDQELTVLTVHMHRHVIRSVIRVSHNRLCQLVSDDAVPPQARILTSSLFHDKHRTRNFAIICSHLCRRQIWVHLLLDRLDFDLIKVDAGMVGILRVVVARPVSTVQTRIYAYGAHYLGVFFGPIGRGNWKKYSYSGLTQSPLGTSMVLSSSAGVAVELAPEDDVVLDETALDDVVFVEVVLVEVVLAEDVLIEDVLVEVALVEVSLVEVALVEAALDDAACDVVVLAELALAELLFDDVVLEDAALVDVVVLDEVTSEVFSLEAVVGDGVAVVVALDDEVLDDVVCDDVALEYVDS